VWNVSDVIKRFEVEGSFAEPEELGAIRHILKLCNRIREYLTSEEVDSSELLKQFSLSEPLDPIIDEIDAVITEDNVVKENASPALAKIFKQIKNAERSVMRKANDLLKHYIEKNYVSGQELTIRDGRLVAPILAEYKRKVEGIITDESAGGKIVYIEPMEVVHLNNELTEFQLKKRQEIIRVLKELSSTLRPYGETLLQGEKVVSAFDFLQAKALYAESYEGEVPTITESPGVHWKKARHPLLLEQSKKSDVVPLDIKLDVDQRMVLVSGPNAGGKSVALKTILLGQLMIQSGLAFPCNPRSEIGVFQKLFVNIGDDQSIENDLSTYSSHLRSMKHFLEQADDSTLICVDELGSGTDPVLGGPLAEAILEGLVRTKAYGVISTHFSNLKQFAEDRDGITNAGMLYDMQRLRPLYELRVGEPGSSFSFEIAGKMGLPKTVIEEARKKVKVTDHEREQLLIGLQTERKRLNDLREELLAKEKEAEEFRKEYRKLYSELEAQKKEILASAKEKALQIIDDSNQKVEKTIHDIRKSEAQKKKTKRVRKSLDQEREKLVKDLTKEKQDTSGAPIEVGDEVMMKGQQVTLEVLEIKGNEALVSNGLIKTRVKKDQLVKTRKTIRKKTRSNVNRTMMNKQSVFNPELDVRGKRTEDALKMVESWLDDAFVLGAVNLRLIHGHGYGILKSQLRNYLKQQHFVDTLNYEHEERGGSGVTLIKLKTTT
jgi:DNA mismatch repair protein MutS2